ncbi:hypothetical protein, partial [Novipirellula maiorica]|uniref:hypothetical protein n=1 Tax=Novipirellula maiorica TaxID=1265734 RepID=UPI001F219410
MGKTDHVACRTHLIGAALAWPTTPNTFSAWPPETFCSVNLTFLANEAMFLLGGNRRRLAEDVRRGDNH